MTSALITRREAAELSGTSETTVKKAVDLKVVPVLRRGSRSGIDLEDVPVLAMLGHLTELRLVADHKRRVREWLRSPDAAPELSLTPVLVLRRVGAIEDTRRRAERYVRLRDEWIVSDPEIKGGDPVIKGSRVSVHTLADRVNGGESDEVLEEDFPHIPPEAREVAVLYARTNPRRGRPRLAPPAD